MLYSTGAIGDNPRLNFEGSKIDRGLIEDPSRSFLMYFSVPVHGEGRREIEDRSPMGKCLPPMIEDSPKGTNRLKQS
jgi:hypothetical protein